MHRAIGLPDLLGASAFGFVAYKTIELGPYEAAILIGRCVHVFVVAMQGYL